VDTSYVVFAVMMFVAVVLSFEGGYQLWASKRSGEAKRLAARLRAIESGGRETILSIERAKPAGVWARLDRHVTKWLPRGEQLARYVSTSGTSRSVAQLGTSTIVLGVIGFFVPLLLARPMIFSFLGAMLLAIVPWFRLSRQRMQRVRAFEKQIPEALDLMSRAMRAGHAFPTAVQMVGEEMADPIGLEFRTLFDQTNYGMPQQEALVQLAGRVPVADLGYFVVAVLIQRESGGNLAELLDNISSIVRARLKLLGSVRTLSAEGRLSAWILLALPFVTGALINIITPQFMAVLWTDSIGLRLVGAALVSMTIGVIWMRKIIQIRV
jgi:tight adherence protein B